MTAPQRQPVAAKPFPAPLHWCARCDDWVEPYTVSVAEAHELGAIFSITDALTGVAVFRLPGRKHAVATDTPLCHGCDAVLEGAAQMGGGL